MRSGDFTSDIRAFNPGGVWGILMAGRVASTNLRETSSFPANDNKILNYFILVIRRPSPRTPRSAASPRRSRRGARAACPCAPEETVLTVLWRIMAGWAACPCAPVETGEPPVALLFFARNQRQTGIYLESCCCYCGFPAAFQPNGAGEGSRILPDWRISLLVPSGEWQGMGISRAGGARGFV